MDFTDLASGFKITISLVNPPTITSPAPVEKKTPAMEKDEREPEKTFTGLPFNMNRTRSTVGNCVRV